MTPKPLPHGPVGDLHILPPWLPWLVACAVAFFAALWIIRFWRSRRRRPAPVPAPTPGTGEAREGFTFVVNRIEDEFGRHRNYRGGLHALAAAVRSRLESLRAIEAEEMTATEIAETLDDQPVTSLLGDLRSHQFRRAEPGKRLFKSMCQRARDVLDPGSGG